MKANGERIDGNPRRSGEAVVNPSEVFDRHRPLLFSIAYRMLGSVIDAENASPRPRFESSPEQEERLMGNFLEACFDGDTEGLLALLPEDVTLWSDGGERPAQPSTRSTVRTRSLGYSPGYSARPCPDSPFGGLR